VPQATATAGIRRDSSEFAHVVGFSDAIFAIAMTLLVLEIGVSGLPEGGGGARDMLDALKDALPEVVSFAAFLPFPTGLLGDYEQNPIAFVVFALSMAAVSLMELVIGHAHRTGLLRPGAPPGVWQ
jgi:uncharacterized membrane protein